jgi:Dolichyl-phosphate-mannose-protein mannosyltransferase
LEIAVALDLKGKTVLSKNKHVHVLACMLALLFCVLGTRPFVSMGVCDDWSYIWTARVLADTGHLIYNGWGAMPLGWLAYLGASFIKLFGFSFTIARFSVLVVSLLCAALMQRVFVRTGASESTATIATLTLVLSPLFLPLSFNFMTDIPALFVLVLCIYCCLRAFQSVYDKTALGWLAFAALSNLAGGTVRQTAWLGVLIMVPSAAWHMRRRRHMLLAGATLWAISALGMVLYLRWFRVQPYAVVDKVFYHYHINSVFFAANTAVVSLLCLLPLMSAFVAKHPDGKRFTQNVATITGASAGALLFWWAMKSPHDYFRTAPFGVDGNYVALTGNLIGPILGFPPAVVPFAARVILAVAIFSGLSCFLVCLVCMRGKLFAADALTKCERSPYPYISNAYLVTLFWVFSLVYLFLIVTRNFVYDRYFLPLQFVFALILVRVYRQTIGERLPLLCSVVGVIYAAYAIATMHDLFALDRARVDAANEIIATGVPRAAIEGGFEYDGWTQLEQNGHLNDSRIIVPVGAYQPWVPPVGPPPPCIGWIRKFTPSLQPEFHLSHAPENCYKPSRFAPFVYETWLPPRRRTIYILEGR